MTRPLLLMDVDGVLNPFPNTPAGFREYDFFPEADGPVRLSALHRDWLHELASVYEVVWATGWGENANRVLAPFFGLPRLPVIPLPPRFEPSDKVPAIDAFAGDRAAAWVDDIVTVDAREWAANRAFPMLLLEIDSAIGLRRSHVDRLLTWASALRAPEPT
jgi:HAD domain in Swiss Army Knife RNA repair proteins